MVRRPPRSTLCPYTTLVRSRSSCRAAARSRGGRSTRGRTGRSRAGPRAWGGWEYDRGPVPRSEEYTSELQSRPYLVFGLLLEQKRRIVLVGGATERLNSDER